MERIEPDLCTEAEASKRILSPELLRSDTAVLLGLASVKLLLHFLTNGQYGYFRDELYYIACGEHLDWGYVDGPPLIAVIAKMSSLLLGDSLFALRFFPALAGAVMVFLTGWIVHELGGQRYAQVLAALAVIVAPFYLAVDTFLSMNAFEPVFWTLGAYIVLRILKTENQRLWLWFGVVSGIGLQNKHSMLFFGFGVFVGLLATPYRRCFRSKWIWVGASIALILFLPNLIWQIHHHWPQLEVLKNARAYKNYAPSPPEFLLGEILLLQPLTFPIWLAGLIFYLFSKNGKAFRALGWTYVVILILLVILKGKIYYLAPAYPMLFASGALVIENIIQQHSWSWLKPALPLILIAGGLVTAPYGLPILPVDTLIKYDRILQLSRSVKVERGSAGKLPQLYADMFGWEKLVATVGKVYNSLALEEKPKCVILAENYGEAGAIDFFGKSYNLPKSISAHDNYYLWGPGSYSGEVAIAVGYSEETLKSIFEQVEPAATILNEYAMPDAKQVSVYICRGYKLSLQQAWPSLKEYI
jgi:4-amino-4-deoxy-L-arabinose transferase-like glycosyltransferase